MTQGRANITPEQLKGIVAKLVEFKQSLETTIQQNKRFVDGIQAFWDDEHYRRFKQSHEEFYSAIQRPIADALPRMVKYLEDLRRTAEAYLAVRKQ
jgi:hypothetical protein